MSTTSEGGRESAPSAAAVVPAELPPSVGLQGAVATFDPTQDDRCEYVEDLSTTLQPTTSFLLRKEDRSYLYAVGASSASIYRLIHTLVSPAKVSEVSFADIVDLAKTHFCPKPSPIVKRFEFNTRMSERRRVDLSLHSGTSQARRAL